MLPEMSVADAYGLGFEFAGPEQLQRNNLRGGEHRYVTHPKYPLDPGQYSDDTEMSMGNAEVLLGDDWSTLAFADKWVECFKRGGKRNGYASGFHAVLCSANDGQDLLRILKPTSDRNGSAMRAVPLGVLANLHEVIEVARRQATITHDTPAGRDGATAVALMAHYLYHAIGPLDQLARWINARVVGPWENPWPPHQQVGIHCVQTAHAAIQLVQAHTSFLDLLHDAVALGGDTDSVAAIACGAATLSESFHLAIPDPLWHGVENGPYGRDYLARLDSRLFAKFPRKTAR